MKHQAWDDGAIADQFAQVFGEGIRPIIANKTTKAQCGKRVSMSSISNGKADCPECLAEIARAQRGRAIINEYERVMQTQGFDAANSIDWANWQPSA